MPKDLSNAYSGSKTKVTCSPSLKPSMKSGPWLVTGFSKHYSPENFSTSMTWSLARQIARVVTAVNCSIG